MTEPLGNPDVTGYGHGHHSSVLASHGVRSAADSCGYLLEYLQPGLSVLDVGCGPGSITLDLADLVGERGRVTGIDFGQEAVAAARRAARERGDDRTAFIVTELFGADLEPGSFDVVHAHQVLQHLTDPVAALRRMGELCRPGGIIAVRDADYGAMSWYPERPELHRWRHVYRDGSRALGAEPDAGRRLRAWARAAGLRVRSVGSSTWTYATADQVRWWGRSQAERVRLSGFADRAAAQGVTPAEVERIAQGWLDWSTDPDAYFCMVHGELLATTPGADGGEIRP